MAQGVAPDNFPATSAILDVRFISADGVGNIWIYDPNYGFFKMDAAGKLSLTWDGTGLTFTPDAMAVARDGTIYVTSRVGRRVWKRSNGTVSVVVGDGVPGSAGDRGLAVNARVFDPYGIAVNVSGDLFIADSAADRIRRVSNGVITTVAGTGSRGFSGDGGLATGATLWAPQLVATVPAGNLYIHDTGNGRIRKVSEGNISTIVGNGASTFGRVYPGGDDTRTSQPARSMTLWSISAIAADSAENLYARSSLVRSRCSERRSSSSAMTRAVTSRSRP